MSSSVLARLRRAGAPAFVLAVLVAAPVRATTPQAALSEPARSSSPPDAIALPPEEMPAQAGEPLFDDAALAPAFTDAAVLDAVAHLAEGRGTAALKLLKADAKDVRLRFLYARALDLSGDRARAAAAYEALGPDYPALAPRLACLAADAYEAGNAWEAASRALATCAKDPWSGRLATINRARFLARAGQRETAVALLEPLLAPGSSRRAEALYAAADIYELLGEGARALELYRTLFIEEPSSPLADKARDQARSLVRQIKVKPIADERLVSRAEKLMVANQLKNAQRTLLDVPTVALCPGGCALRRCDLPAPKAEPRPDPARTFALGDAKDDEPGADVDPALPACAVEEVKDPAPALACRAQVVRAWVARRTKANTKALELAREAYARCADADVRARALFLAAGAAGAVKDPDAVGLALLAGRQFPAFTTTDDALLAAGVVARDAKDGATERTLLRLLIRGQPDSDQRAEALFRLFWSHRAAGRAERGLPALELLAREYEAGPRSDGGDGERGRYWWGRTVAQAAATADERQRGTDALVKLARERPLTYYGLLARSTLASFTPPLDVPPLRTQPHPGALRVGLLADDAGYVQALEFWRMGLVKEARELLLVVDHKPLRKDGRRGRESTVLVAELVRRIGDDRSAHAIVRRELLKHLREGTDALAMRAARAAFPLAFRELVVDSATRAGFTPNLLQGLMREESALDPKAKSPVGARGLTQVMPATGRQVARGMGLKRFHPDELWVPETNLRIGGVYLGSLLKSFGHPGLAAAAYNAGPGAVARWLAAAPPMPFDAFVEEIPFSETRGYVKRVLRSYASYDLLYGDEKAAAMRVSLLVRGTLAGQ